jgi:hypothetical protein
MTSAFHKLWASQLRKRWKWPENLWESSCEVLDKRVRAEKYCSGRVGGAGNRYTVQGWRRGDSRRGQCGDFTMV